jgi:hypothetical protein
VDGWMDGWMEGWWMYRWMDGRLDGGLVFGGWMDGLPVSVRAFLAAVASSDDLNVRKAKPRDCNTVRYKSLQSH